MNDPKFLAFLLVLFIAGVGKVTGQIGEGSLVAILTADLWAYMTGHVGAVVANGWAVAKAKQAEKRVSGEGNS